MIFHDLQAIYFHIGKTAGFAVERMLCNKPRNAGIADRRQMFGWDPDEKVYLQHATAGTVKRLAGDELFDRYYKFSIVRNPFSRMVSVYYYLYDQHERQFGSFTKYIEGLPSLVNSAHCQKGSHHIPQISYTQVDRQNVCNYIAYFEHLPISLEPVRSQLGLSKVLEKHNTHRHPARGDRSVAEHYTKGGIGIVQDLFAADFTTYGYSVDPDKLEPLMSCGQALPVKS